MICRERAYESSAAETVLGQAWAGVQNAANPSNLGAVAFDRTAKDRTAARQSWSSAAGVRFS